MVYNTAGVFLGTALANILTELDKTGKQNVVIVNQDTLALIHKFTPISRYAGFVTCGAAANFFTDYISPVNLNTPVLFRIQVSLSVAGVFSAVYKLGSDVKVIKFNSGVALVADCLYIFDCLVHPNDSINFQSSLAGTANIRIQEIAMGVQ
jgi:hypothetical protein